MLAAVDKVKSSNGLHCGVAHLATVLERAVREAAVALRADLHLIGALQQQSLLQVPCGLVHVGDAVLAVVSHVLGGFSRQQPEEGELDAGGRVFLSVAELQEQRRRRW